MSDKKYLYQLFSSVQEVVNKEDYETKVKEYFLLFASYALDDKNIYPYWLRFDKGDEFIFAIACIQRDDRFTEIYRFFYSHLDKFWEYFATKMELEIKSEDQVIYINVPAWFYDMIYTIIPNSLKLPNYHEHKEDFFSISRMLSVRSFFIFWDEMVERVREIASKMNYSYFVFMGQEISLKELDFHSYNIKTKIKERLRENGYSDII